MNIRTMLELRRFKRHRANMKKYNCNTLLHYKWPITGQYITVYTNTTTRAQYIRGKSYNKTK